MSEESENIAAALQDSYLLKIGVQSFAITLVATLIIG